MKLAKRIVSVGFIRLESSLSRLRSNQRPQRCETVVVPCGVEVVTRLDQKPPSSLLAT